MIIMKNRSKIMNDSMIMWMNINRHVTAGGARKTEKERVIYAEGKGRIYK